MMRTVIVTSRVDTHASGSGNPEGMMHEAGFERVEYFNLTAGVAALHTGIKL